MNDLTKKTNEDIVTYSNFDRKRKKKSAVRAVSIIAVALVLVAVISFIIVKKYFVVKSVIVNGSETYSSAEIKASCGISEGDVIFFVRAADVRKRLAPSYPFIRTVEIEKEYPSGVNVIITEEEPVYCFEYDGEFFVMSREMKLLEKSTEKERITGKFKNVKPVTVPPVYKAVLSDRLLFVSEKDTRHVGEVLYELYGWSGYDKISEIDISNRFDIRIVYDGRITVRFGSKSGFLSKLKFAEGIIMAYSGSSYGEIIIDSTKEAVARITDPEADQSKDSPEG